MVPLTENNWNRIAQEIMDISAILEVYHEQESVSIEGVRIESEK